MIERVIADFNSVVWSCWLLILFVVQVQKKMVSQKYVVQVRQIQIYSAKSSEYLHANSLCVYYKKGGIL